MNEIERMFFDAFIEAGEERTNIRCQVPMGIYLVDFVIYPDAIIPSIVEIDGHEYHKTKEQRFADYQKERFYMSQGYTVIRFMGSEVYVDAEKCVQQAISLSSGIDEIATYAYELGVGDRERENNAK